MRILMNKKEVAIQLHNSRYNCAQSVACAFADEVGVEKETLFKACESFGLGMGGMEGTCGAITGAVMLAGFKNSDGSIDNPKTKASTYALSRKIVERFQTKNQATRCKDLKGIETGTVLRSCAGCIEDAVELVEEIIL